MVELSASGKKEIQNVLSEAVNTRRAPGLVFGATTAEEELYIAHAGPRDFGDPKSEPITLDSIFWICSQTKMIISIGIFQLIDAGKLTLDTPASKFLPELANPIILNADSMPEKPNFRPATEEITIKHLLSHSSGLSYGPEKDRPSVYHPPGPYAASHDQDNPVSNFYSLLKGTYPSQPLNFEPGSSFTYGYNSDSLGFIIERISGQSLEQYFKEHIFSPLGITSASFYLTPELKKKAVPLVFRELDGKIVPWAGQIPLIEQDPQKVRLHLGGIGLYCSMKDYLTLLRHLLQVHAGKTQNPILTKASLQTFFQPVLTPAGEKAVEEMLQETDYQWSTALCVNTTDVAGGRKKGSAWWYGWVGTYHFMDPETGVAVVFGSQLLPRRDAEIVGLWKQLEQVFYKGLTSD